MLDSVLPLTENSFTGSNVLISGVEMGVLEDPLHEVNIRSNLINGNIVIGKEEIGFSGTFLENIEGNFEENNKSKVEKALTRSESRNVKGNIPGKQESESKSVISRQNFIEEQSNEKELLDLFVIALTQVEAEKVSVSYLIKDNILMRKWSSHHFTIAPLL